MAYLYLAQDCFNKYMSASISHDYSLFVIFMLQ